MKSLIPGNDDESLMMIMMMMIVVVVVMVGVVTMITAMMSVYAQSKWATNTHALCTAVNRSALMSGFCLCRCPVGRVRRQPQ